MRLWYHPQTDRLSAAEHCEQAVCYNNKSALRVPLYSRGRNPKAPRDQRWPLSAEDKRAEEARVNREIAANQKKAVIPFVGLAGGMSLSPGEHRWADTVQGLIVKTSIFTNERRVMYRERPAIQIEFTGNPKFKPRSDEQRVAQSTRTSFEVAAQRAARVRTLPCSHAPALRTW